MALKYKNYFLFGFVVSIVILAAVLYLFRATWTPLLPRISNRGLTFRHLYSNISSSFADDEEAGFSSNSFSLRGNIDSGDSRQGLDDAGKREVKRIMRRDKVGFDEARSRYMQSRFARNNIGPDGRPRDPKLVTFD